MKGNLMVRLMTLLILVAIVLTHFSGQTDLLSANWLWLAIMPAFMGLQATYTGFCPAEMIGKLSKTGECCPGGTCGTGKPQTKAKASSCCGSNDNASTENTESSPCCGEAKDSKESTSACCGASCEDALLIKVLGTGCANCNNTVKLIQATADEQNIAVHLVKVEEIAEIASYGIMSTPGVVINEQTVHSGSIPSKKAITEWLSKFNH